MHLCGVEVATSMRERTLYNTVERAPANHGQDKQILRMEKQSVKIARVLDIGYKIFLPIPVVDKRSTFDSPT